MSGGAPALARVDHLVYATPDLELSIDELQDRLGVRAVPGGQHLGRGTRNALIALSDASYLEIIGPDPGQPHPNVPRWFGIDTLRGPRLLAWAAKASGLKELAGTASRRGVELGAVAAGSRTRADGVVLAWEFTDPATVLGDGLVPFFIDWAQSPHPAATAARGPVLVSLHGEHPDPDAILRELAIVGIELPVERSSSSCLIARFRTENGEVELR